MALKKILNIMKTDSESLVAKIDKFLVEAADESAEDRGHGLNSPSSVGYCERAVIYGRLGYKKTSITPPRLRRIFDNGSYTHDRLQTYLEKMGMLKLREVPVWDEELQILGHSDGLLKITPLQLAILEIKTINDNGFSKLMEAKPEHLHQAHVYMYCLEKLRLAVRGGARAKKLLASSYLAIIQGFIVDGHRYTREQKIAYSMDYFNKTLDILQEVAKPISNVVLLYENKNNQDLKSFVVTWNDEIIEEIKERFIFLNDCVVHKAIPNRPEGATGKTCSMCRGCDYADKCY